jgi:hypothetical protein
MKDQHTPQDAYRCLDLIIDNFKDSDIYEYTQESHSFLFYSALYWSQHASLAHDEFHILQSQSIFLEAQSSVRDAWQSFLSYHEQDHFLGDSLIELASEWGCLPIVNYILRSPGLVGDIQDLLVTSAERGSARLCSFLLTQPTTSITPRVIAAALRNNINGREISNILLNGGEIPLSIPESEYLVQKSVVHGKIEFIQWYLQHYDDTFVLIDGLFEAIVRTRDRGPPIMSLILHHLEDRVLVTEQHMRIAARQCDGKVMALLMDHSDRWRVCAGRGRSRRTPVQPDAR